MFSKEVRDELKKKYTLFSVLKRMMKIGLMICVFFVSIQVGNMWVEYSHDNPDGSIWEFLTYKEVEEASIYNPVFSERMLEKVQRYNNTTRTVWIALFFFVMFEVFSYMEDKKNHWINYAVKGIEKFWNKVKSNDEEE